MSESDLLEHHYRPAMTAHDCGNCSFYADGHCSMFDEPVDAEYVCDAWKARGAVGKIEPEELAYQVADMTNGLAKAANLEAHLRVVGVMTHPSGQRVYRLATRDDHYVGRTNPTKTRALKGDVVKVSARHAKIKPSGDVDWTNLEVDHTVMTSRGPLHPGARADSHRDLLRRIGGGNVTPEMAMLKDNATDVPAAGDQGTIDPDQVANVPMGPTSNTVHVNAPLKNVSVFYGKKKVAVVKAWGRDQQILYGVVLEPDVFDQQGDYVPRAHVEKAAHGYMKKVARGRASVSKLRHRVRALHPDRPSVVPVESFIAPCDFTYDGSNEPVKKGTWVMAFHVEDPALWDDVVSGKYDALSIGGAGRRKAITPAV